MKNKKLKKKFKIAGGVAIGIGILLMVTGLAGTGFGLISLGSILFFIGMAETRQFVQKKEIKNMAIKENKDNLKTSQKVATFGTVCFFASFLFFFIFWPIGVILFILAIISTGAFYGFQNTERTEDIKKIRENLEQKEKVNLCSHCGKYYEGQPNFCPNCGEKL